MKAYFTRQEDQADQVNGSALRVKADQSYGLLDPVMGKLDLERKPEADDKPSDTRDGQ